MNQRNEVLDMHTGQLQDNVVKQFETLARDHRDAVTLAEIKAMFLWWRGCVVFYFNRSIVRLM